MKDPRLETLAANLLDYSLEIKAGEKVLLEADASAVDLMIALVEGCLRARRGALHPYRRLPVEPGVAARRQARADGAQRQVGDAAHERRRRDHLRHGRRQRLRDGRRARAHPRDVARRQQAAHGPLSAEEVGAAALSDGVGRPGRRHVDRGVRGLLLLGLDSRLRPHGQGHGPAGRTHGPHRPGAHHRRRAPTSPSPSRASPSSRRRVRTTSPTARSSRLRCATRSTAPSPSTPRRSKTASPSSASS